MKLLAIALSAVAMYAQAVRLDPEFVQDHDNFMKNFIGDTDVKSITNDVKQETSKPKFDFGRML